jgi:hypothetical protein
MKKVSSNITSNRSFFISKSCKTSYQKSVQCKQGASWSAGPLANNSRANKMLNGTASIGGETGRKVCHVVLQKARIQHAIFCYSSFESIGTHRLYL